LNVYRERVECDKHPSGVLCARLVLREQPNEHSTLRRTLRNELSSIGIASDHGLIPLD
jgi:hypothetical protein